MGKPIPPPTQADLLRDPAADYAPLVNEPEHWWVNRLGWIRRAAAAEDEAKRLRAALRKALAVGLPPHDASGRRMWEEARSALTCPQVAATPAATPEEFQRICDVFEPSPRKLPADQFGRFARAWGQPRVAPAGYNEAEWLRGWDQLDQEYRLPEPDAWEDK